MRRASIDSVAPPLVADAFSSEPVQNRPSQTLDTTTVICSVYSFVTQMQGTIRGLLVTLPRRIPGHDVSTKSTITILFGLDNILSSRLVDIRPTVERF